MFQYLRKFVTVILVSIRLNSDEHLVIIRHNLDIVLKVLLFEKNIQPQNAP